MGMCNVMDFHFVKIVAFKTRKIDTFLYNSAHMTDTENKEKKEEINAVDEVVVSDTDTSVSKGVVKLSRSEYKSN